MAKAKKVRIDFRNGSGETKLLGYCGEKCVPPSPDDSVVKLYPDLELKNCMKMINRYLTNNPYFNHYYTRVIFPRNDDSPFVWTFDVGSWSEFFFVTYEGEEWGELTDNYFDNVTECFELKYPTMAQKVIEEEWEEDTQ